MTTYQHIRTSRRLVWGGIVLGYTVAIAVGILNLRSDDGTPFTALAFVAMLSIPSTIALFSLDRRPSLLTAATMAALFPGVILLFSVIGLIYFVMAILWYLASQRRPRPPAAPGWAVWGRPLLAAATILPLVMMFIHLDPVCTFTDPAGNVTVQTATGYPSGWRFSLGTTGISSSDGSGTRSCTSDTVQPWEAIASLAVSAVIVLVASRWPTAEAIGQTVGQGKLENANNGVLPQG